MQYDYAFTTRGNLDRHRGARREDNVERHRENPGGRGRQRWGRCFCKPRIAKLPGKPQKAGKEHGPDSPSHLSEAANLTNTLISDFQAPRL